jgi:DNA-binding MarR family transcriptional regulator
MLPASNIFAAPVPREPLEPDPLNPEEFDAWRGLLRLHEHVTRELDRRLTREHDLPLLAYGVLITLVTVPERRLRMTDLAARVLVSPSGITRLVERLAREGLVTRERDPADGRSFHAVLTPAGLRRLRRAQVTHHAVARERYLGNLSAAELRSLGELYERAVPGVVTAADWPEPTDIE